MSIPINTTCVDLLVHYGRKLSHTQKGVNESRPPDKIPGKAFMNAPMVQSISREDNFLFTVCSSGIARVLQLVSNKKLETINDVKTLWFHYTIVGNFLTNLYALFNNKIEQTGDPKDGVSYLNLVGSQAQSYFMGTAYEAPPEYLIPEIDRLLEQLIIINEKTISFTSNTTYVGLEEKVGISYFKFSVEEDEDLYDSEVLRVEYTPKKKEYSYDDIRHLVERTPAKAAVVTPQKAGSSQPATRADRFFADSEDDFARLEEARPFAGIEPVKDFVRKICSDDKLQGLAFYKVLGKIAELLKFYYEGGPRPPEDQHTNICKAELIALLWGIIPDGKEPVRLIPEIKPEPKELPIREPSTPPDKEGDSSSPKAGKKKRYLIIETSILGIKLDPKKLVPHIFLGTARPRLKRLVDCEDEKSRKIPQRRTISEFRTGVINARVDRRTATFSNTGLSKGQRKRAKNRALEKHPIDFSDANYQGYNDYPDDYDDDYRYINV